MKARHTELMIRVAAIALGLLAAAAAMAQADPMRPLSAPATASAAAPGRTPRSAAAPAPVKLPPLVAIREDSDGRRRALVGERWLVVGDRIEGLAVTTIAPHQVELAQGRERRTLHLLAPLLAATDGHDAAARPTAEPAAPRPATRPAPSRGTAVAEMARGTGSSRP